MNFKSHVPTEHMIQLISDEAGRRRILCFVNKKQTHRKEKLHILQNLSNVVSFCRVTTQAMLLQWTTQSRRWGKTERREKTKKNSLDSLQTLLLVLHNFLHSVDLSTGRKKILDWKSWPFSGLSITNSIMISLCSHFCTTLLRHGLKFATFLQDFREMKENFLFRKNKLRSFDRCATASAKNRCNTERKLELFFSYRYTNLHRRCAI